MVLKVLAVNSLAAARRGGGTHVITASYPANGSFAGSNASAVNVTVTSAAAANATSTSIIGAANPGAGGTWFYFHGDGAEHEQ